MSETPLNPSGDRQRFVVRGSVFEAEDPALQEALAGVYGLRRPCRNLLPLRRAPLRQPGDVLHVGVRGTGEAPAQQLSQW